MTTNSTNTSEPEAKRQKVDLAAIDSNLMSAVVANEQPTQFEEVDAPLTKEQREEQEKIDALSIKNTARESEVGISKYVNEKSQGFSGTIKSRYTDFIVREIGLDGQVVKLTELEAPFVEKPEVVVEEKLDMEQVYTELEALVGNKVMLQVKDTIENKNIQEISSEPISDKAARTNIHAFV